MKRNQKILFSGILVLLSLVCIILVLFASNKPTAADKNKQGEQAIKSAQKAQEKALQNLNSARAKLSEAKSEASYYTASQAVQALNDGETLIGKRIRVRAQSPHYNDELKHYEIDVQSGEIYLMFEVNADIAMVYKDVNAGDIITAKIYDSKQYPDKGHYVLTCYDLKKEK